MGENPSGQQFPITHGDQRAGVEPMTCAPNGLASGDGLLALDPGESITTRWGIIPTPSSDLTPNIAEEIT